MPARTLARLLCGLSVLLTVTRTTATSDTPVVRIDERPTRGEIVVTVGPIDIPASTGYEHHPGEERARVRWTTDGWLRGFRIDVVDAGGHLLPREMLHHAGIVNLARRQLAYPQVERIAAVGRETDPVLLPASMGVPLSAGQDLLIYYALVNPTGQDVTGVSLRLTLTMTPLKSGTPTSVFPLFLDANPQKAGSTRSFDVPPGLSVTRSEFTLPMGGHLRALGAHLHDHAVEIRLEDVVTGKVLARLTARNSADGVLQRVDSTKFLLKRKGLRLDANHPYRVVAVYDNPTGTPITGAMAFLAGPFIPDDAQAWPTIDPNDPAFQYDLSTILGAPAAAPHRHGHGGGALSWF